MAFPGGKPDLSKAVLRLRIQYEKGFKGDKNVWRDITSTSLNIPGMAHMCMPTLVLLYAMRQGKVSGSLDEVIRTAAASRNHSIQWLGPKLPFIHRWGHRKLFREALYKEPMTTEHYLIRFKEVCQSAGFGDQRVHAVRRGAARDSKDVTSEAHNRNARSAVVLGHSNRSDQLSATYGLRETNNEYNERLGAAMAKAEDVFDYSGFVGGNFSEDRLEKGGKPAILFPIDAPKRLGAEGGRIISGGKRQYPYGTVWEKLGKSELKRAAKERGMSMGSSPTKAYYIERILAYDEVQKAEGRAGEGGDGGGEAGEGVEEADLLGLDGVDIFTRAMAQFQYEGDGGQLDDEGEDELWDITAEAIESTPDVLQPHLESAEAFIEFFVKFNEITTGGMESMRMRDEAMLKAELTASSQLGRHLNEPSFWIYDKVAGVRWLAKSNIAQESCYESKVTATARTKAKEKEKDPGDTSTQKKKRKAPEPVKIKEPMVCPLKICEGVPKVWELLDNFKYHLKVVHGLTGSEVYNHIKGGVDGTTRKRKLYAPKGDKRRRISDGSTAVAGGESGDDLDAENGNVEGMGTGDGTM